MIRRLRISFVCIFMVIVSLMLSAVIFTVIRFTRTNLRTESLRIMESIAADPMQLGAQSLGGGEPLPYFALQLGRRNEVLAINGAYFDMLSQDVVRDLIERTLYDWNGEGELEDYNLRYCRRVNWNACVIVFADLSGEERTMHRLRRACVGIGAASFAAFFLLSLLLARWMVKPVEKAWELQHQFVSDASHELKTPLTVILTNAELLQQADYSAEEKGKFSSNILTMATQMRGLVESLLDLARVDNGMARAVWEKVNLSSTVIDATLPFEPVYFEKGLTLESGVEDGIQVQGSEQHLRRVVEILLDNAQKYSATPAVVMVRLLRQGRGQCLLTVANPGDPIAPEELQKIFKRFYRADPARCRNGSYGLGLPIAEGIVREHRGRIWATSQNGWNTFHVTLPTI